MDSLVGLAIAVIVITAAATPRWLRSPRCPLPTRWIGTALARRDLAVALARRDGILAVARAAGTRHQTPELATADAAVAEAETALHTSRRPTRTHTPMASR